MQECDARQVRAVMGEFAATPVVTVKGGIVDVEEIALDSIADQSCIASRRMQRPFVQYVARVVMVCH